MCYDLNEYDPFEPIVMDYDKYDEWTVESYPMNDYDWEEWLDNGSEPYMI